MRKSKIIVLMLMIMIFLHIMMLKTLADSEENLANSEFEVTISYEYQAQTNTVIVHALSNRELIQKTLPGWILGEDKKSYTAIYDTNQTFSTNFTDLNGNKIAKEIVINLVDDKGPVVQVNYVCNANNTVTVMVTSNEKMIQKTLAGWELGTDQMSYTATYDQNQTFTTNFTDVYGNKTAQEIVIHQIDEEGYPSIEISYEFQPQTNTVVVHATSNRKLIQKTLPGWVLSEDKMSYTAEYTTNQTFSTNFTDLYGNKTTKEIVIDLVDDKGPELKVNYIPNADNTVTVIVTSNEEMVQKTLPGWVLGQDKKTYTATYETNQTFSTNFTDIYGNKTEQEIVIDQIDQSGSPNIDIKYEYSSDTNTVTVYATSDRKLIQKTLAGWILGEDQMSYTAIYEANQTFSTNFTDIYGNKIEKEIVIDQIDDKGPEVDVDYFYHEDNNTVTVTVTSNEEMIQKTLAGWVLGEDKMSYTAEYTTNQTFDTNFTDIYGNKTATKIKVDQIDDKGPEVQVSYSFDSSRTVCTVTVTANEEMKQKTLAGWVLSENKRTYTASYTNNQMFFTNFTDKWGNVTTVAINVVFNRGIDVSEHNGKINWTEVKNSGIAFAIIRCGYGADVTSQDDAYFQYNILECERLGIPYGVYLYSYALTEEGAYSEANHVLRLIRGHNPTLGVWIDMEDADGYKGRYGMPSNQTLVNICDIFCSVMRANGYQTGTYASLNWWNNQLNSAQLNQYDKWVAQWNIDCTYGGSYVMWQYTSSGSVPGILTNVDMNIYYR